MQPRRVALEEQVGEHKPRRSVSSVEVNGFYTGATDRHERRCSCDRAPGGERQAQMQKADALQVLEKDGDFLFVALEVLSRRANQIVVEI